MPEAPPASTKPPMSNGQFIMQCVVFILLWWAGAVAVTVVIKETLQPSHNHDAVYPFPFALTSMSNGLCALLGLVVSTALRPCSGDSNEIPPRLSQGEVATLVAIGAIQGVEIGCNNKALEFLTVATRTMIGSTNVVCMMVVARLWGLEQFDFPRCAALFLLTVGSAMQGVGHRATDSVFAHGVPHGVPHWTQAAWVPQGQLKGVLLMCVSMILASIRWCCLQTTLQRAPEDSAMSKMTKLQLIMTIMPCTSLVCFCFALIFEGTALHTRWYGPSLFVRVLSITMLVMGLVFAELALVKLTSALCLNVLATLHQIPIVLVGMAVFGDGVSTHGTTGFALCLLGALVYARARSSSDHTAPVERPPPQSDALDTHETELRSCMVPPPVPSAVSSEATPLQSNMDPLLYRHPGEEGWPAQQRLEIESETGHQP